MMSLYLICSAAAKKKKKRQITACVPLRDEIQAKDCVRWRHFGIIVVYFSASNNRGRLQPTRTYSFPHRASITMREVSATDYALILRVKQWCLGMCVCVCVGGRGGLVVMCFCVFLILKETASLRSASFFFSLLIIMDYKNGFLSVILTFPVVKIRLWWRANAA